MKPVTNTNANAHKKHKQFNHRKHPSIIYDLFQGKMEVTTLAKCKTGVSGSDSGVTGGVTEGVDMKPQFEETATTAPFSLLSLKIPAVPLFKDTEGGLVIPQIPLMELLQKYDGDTWTTVGESSTGSGSGSGDESVVRRKYTITHLPQYLFIHLVRYGLGWIVCCVCIHISTSIYLPV